MESDYLTVDKKMNLTCRPSGYVDYLCSIGKYEDLRTMSVHIESDNIDGDVKLDKSFENEFTTIIPLKKDTKCKIVNQSDPYLDKRYTITCK